jgi:hypothetical protein
MTISVTLVDGGTDKYMRSGDAYVQEAFLGLINAVGCVG